MAAVSSEKELDTEWVQLIEEALDFGISIEEIRDFLNKKRLTQKVVE
ncbi:anti-repressor SinI family protein [Neobacillus citreus]|uniref:Anti-repressor SinI family protein n=1 Tax=Neobacillus citreus TaxID=2833578 RepID=A0A942T3N7_9BACI|nr:anti-repressor SinI family protein [Neobacillus citreus]MCH6265993.1 anti-repressor SinI family protein [Neobacillus citreus]